MREIRHCLSNLIIYAKGLNDKIKLDHIRSNSPPQRDQWRQQQPLKLYSLNEINNDEEASIKQLYSMQPNNENMKTLIEQIHMERDRSLSLKTNLTATEEQLNQEKMYLQDLESLLKKISLLRSIDPQIAKYLGDLVNVSKELSLIRYDIASLGLKIQQKEQRY